MGHSREIRRIGNSKSFIHWALALIIVSGWAMVFGPTALADASPPAQPPGSNIEPGCGTMVQMVAENVLLWVYSLGNDVSIIADFAMRNQGTEREVLAVRFPMENPNGSGDGWDNHDWQVKNFSVRVDGSQVPFKVVEESYTGTEVPIPWATFEVEFPPSEDVIISVSYFTELHGRDFASINYVLGTGGGWYGPIGSAVITLRLPYAVSPTNVPFISTIGSDSEAIYVGNEVRWQIQNYEPDTYATFTASIIWPSSWQEILDLEARIGKDPGDLEGVLSLIEAYRFKDEVKGYIPSQDFRALSNYTILQALASDPSNPDLNAELAFNRWWDFPVDILNALHIGPSDPFEFTDVDVNHPVVLNVLRPLMIALKEEPDNQKALDLLGEIKSMLGDFELPDEIPAFDLPVYTSTPQPTEWIFLTSTPRMEDIKEPPLSTSVPEPTSTKITPIPLASPTPALQAESNTQTSEGSDWMGFLGVGLVSLLVGGTIGYFIAKR